MATENQHRPNDFTPVVGAMSLAEYVFHITDNTNKFPDFTVKEEKNPDGTVTQMIIYRPDSLTNTVRDEARGKLTPSRAIASCFCSAWTLM